MRPIRVLHCPATVGGNPVQLALAERALGLESVSVTLEDTPFAFGADEVIWRAGDRALRRELKRWRVVLRALREFDIVHFNFGSSLMPRRVPIVRPEGGGRTALRAVYALYTRLVELHDLPLLRRAGKGIVVTYQGDDARQGDVSRALYELSLGSIPGYYTPEADEGNRRMIAAFDRYADRIFALNPDLLAVLPERAEFLPYGNIDPADWPPSFREPGDIVRVVHAPTHRAGKGTEHVIEAVDCLRAEGIPVELDLVEGLTRAQAREAYGRADLAVDQLLSGWYGGFAVELMALGKPVVAYIREADLVRIPAEMRRDLPVVSATPETVAATLRRLVTEDRHALIELGRRSRAYVERWHDPHAVARRLKETYEQILDRPAA